MHAGPAVTSVPDEIRLRDELISRLAHEARTPIGAIVTWLEVLKCQSSGSPQAARAIEMAQRSTRHLTEIIASAEDTQQIIAKTIELRTASLDLGGLLHSVIDRLLPAAQARRITLDCETPSSARPARGDEARLRHTFTRILAHCVGLSGAGPMQLRIQDQGTEVRVDLLCPALTLSAVLLDALQDDREWPSPAGPCGQIALDFAVACRVFALHGGRLEAESVAGQGTRVSAMLPTAPAHEG
jgi:signal transduction histidine kinase